jgi:hypothetical protein
LVHDVKPIAAILESRMSAVLAERLPVDAEAMIRAELGPKLPFGNADAMIAAPLPPVTVLGASTSMDGAWNAPVFVLSS